MSKRRSLPRLDARVERSAQYPDINEFLKDTQSSNYLDNQSSARLTLVLDRQEFVQLVDSVPVAGFIRAFYLTNSHFYGYNPDVEALEKVVLTLPTFDGFTQEFTRAGVNYRFATLTAAETSIGDSLKNYRLSLSTRAVAQLISYIFDTKAEEAFNYFSVAESDAQEYTPEALLAYVGTNLYSVSVPVQFDYYYFNSEQPAFSISSQFSLKDLLSFLKEDFAPDEIQFRVQADAPNFELSLRAKRPIVLSVVVTVGGQDYQEDLTVFASQELQTVEVRAGYAAYFATLAKFKQVDQLPTILVRYTYRPLGYSLEVADVAYVAPYVDAYTSQPITPKVWFFGNYPRAVAGIGSADRLVLTLSFTSKVQHSVRAVQIRVDNNTETPIDRVVPVTGDGITDAAYRNEMAELTFSLGDLGTSQPAQTTESLSISNGNRVITNVALGFPGRFARLITNVNQVGQPYDTLEALAPVEAVTLNSDLTYTYDSKLRQYTYTLTVQWPDYPAGSVLWPFLTGTRLRVKLLDLLLRPIASGDLMKGSTEIYSPAKTWLNPLRLSRTEANYEETYKKWFPKYPVVLVNGSATIRSKKLSFVPSDLVASIDASVFSTDLSGILEVPSKVAKQSLTFGGQFLTGSPGFQVAADAPFFTRLFLHKFVTTPEQYGYLLDQAVVAVSKKVGRYTVFYRNRLPNPFLAALDPQGSTGSSDLGPLVGRFVPDTTLSRIVRTLTGDSASKKVKATIYLVTALHPVLNAKGLPLYYEVKYDDSYKMIPGIIFSFTGAWA